MSIAPERWPEYDEPAGDSHSVESAMPSVVQLTDSHTETEIVEAITPLPEFDSSEEPTNDELEEIEAEPVRYATDKELEAAKKAAENASADDITYFVAVVCQKRDLLTQKEEVELA